MKKSKRKWSSFLDEFVLWLISFYKKYLSFLFWGSCRFSPTCSQYTYQQVRRHGTIRGLLLGFKRFLRCNPWFS